MKTRGKIFGVFRIGAFGVMPFWFAAITAQAHPGAGIVVNRQGQVFFTDTGRGVWKIDAQGNLTLVSEMAFHWMALDENGHFGGPGSARFSTSSWEIRRITPEGVRPAIIIASDWPITVGFDGHLYYAPYPGQAPLKVVRMAADGRTSPFATLSESADGEPLGWFNGVTTAPDGAIYFAENRALRKITRDGIVSVVAQAIRVPGCSESSGPDMPPVPSLRGLAVDALGNVFAAATGCRCVLKITEQGVIETLLRADPPWSPTGITLHKDEIYVLEYDHTPVSGRDWPPRVRKISADGTVTTLVSIKRSSSR